MLLVPICAFTPGFALLRHSPWRPLEKLCAAVALSLVIVFLVAFAGFVAGAGPGLAWLTSLVCVLLGGATYRDARALLHDRTVRRALLGLAALVAWSGALLLLLRHYSGGTWYGDWLEHFERARFFLHRLPLDAVIFGGYQVPARPPMENVLVAFFLAQSADLFELFQVVALLLGSLVLLPCLLVARELGRGAARGTAVLVALLALNPVFVQHVTYPWTKLLADFFVLLAIAFYLRGWRRGDNGRIIAAFAALAAGTLVHYSAGPYLVLVAAHYLVAVLPRRPHRARELATVTGVGALVLLPWTAWSLATYGVTATFASNTTVTDAARFTLLGNATKIVLNLRDTLLPHFLRGAGLGYFDQTNLVGLTRDFCFLAYQGCLPLAIGLVGGVVAAVVAARGLLGRQRIADPGTRRFWLLFVGAGTVLGVAVHGQREFFGLTAIGLTPIVLLGVALVAVSLPGLPRPLRWAVVAGTLVDLVCGVLLQTAVESAGAWPVGGRLGAAGVFVQGLSRVAIANWRAKVAAGVELLGDHLGAAPAVELAVLGFAAAALGILVATAIGSRKRLRPPL